MSVLTVLLIILLTSRVHSIDATDRQELDKNDAGSGVKTTVLSSVTVKHSDHSQLNTHENTSESEFEHNTHTAPIGPKRARKAEISRTKLHENKIITNQSSDPQFESQTTNLSTHKFTETFSSDTDALKMLHEPAVHDSVSRQIKNQSPSSDSGKPKKQPKSRLHKRSAKISENFVYMAEPMFFEPSETGSGRIRGERGLFRRSHNGFVIGHPLGGDIFITTPASTSQRQCNCKRSVSNNAHAWRPYEPISLVPPQEENGMVGQGSFVKRRDTDFIIGHPLGGDIFITTSRPASQRQCHCRRGANLLPADYRNHNGNGASHSDRYSMRERRRIRDFPPIMRMANTKVTSSTTDSNDDMIELRRVATDPFLSGMTPIEDTAAPEGSDGDLVNTDHEDSSLQTRKRRRVLTRPPTIRPRKNKSTTPVDQADSQSQTVQPQSALILPPMQGMKTSKAGASTLGGRDSQLIGLGQMNHWDSRIKGPKEHPDLVSLHPTKWPCGAIPDTPGWFSPCIHEKPLNMVNSSLSQCQYPTSFEQIILCRLEQVVKQALDDIMAWRDDWIFDTLGVAYSTLEKEYEILHYKFLCAEKQLGRPSLGGTVPLNRRSVPAKPGPQRNIDKRSISDKEVVAWWNKLRGFAAALEMAAYDQVNWGRCVHAPNKWNVAWETAYIGIVQVMCQLDTIHRLKYHGGLSFNNVDADRSNIPVDVLQIQYIYGTEARNRRDLIVLKDYISLLKELDAAVVGHINQFEPWPDHQPAP